MPRWMASSAISRPVHWLIGRSDPAGASQASAVIWQTCSAVIRHGPPGCGASSNRSAAPNSSGGTAARPSQRVRHKRAVPTLTPNRLAICALFAPPAAARMMRARSASCCAVPCRRASASSCGRSSAVNTTVGGFGPRIRILAYSCHPSDGAGPEYTAGLFTPPCTSASFPNYGADQKTRRSYAISEQL